MTYKAETLVCYDCREYYHFVESRLGLITRREMDEGNFYTAREAANQDLSSYIETELEGMVILTAFLNDHNTHRIGLRREGESADYPFDIYNDNLPEDVAERYTKWNINVEEGDDG